MKVATVYLVTNKTNGKRYVGITQGTAEKRWAAHRKRAKHKPSTTLHWALRKYGEANFSCVDIASCLELGSAAKVEREIIAELKPEYNQTAGGEFSVWTIERRERANRALRGRSLSAASRRKISEAKKGKPPSAAAIAATISARSLPVECIDTGQIFSSIRSAALALGLHETHVGAVCNGNAKTTGGLRFGFIEKEPV